MLAAVRVRGVPDTSQKVSKTLQSLQLHQKNNCMLVVENNTNEGMLTTAKDYIAYGDIDTDTIESLLAKRGKVSGTPLEDAVDELGYESISDLVSALEDEDVTLHKLKSKGLQIPFRLSPPSKGYKDTKQQYYQGGTLGEREDMDELLRRMI